jgi:23S rRNA (guanine745-N1)-methyltransferase
LLASLCRWVGCPRCGSTLRPSGTLSVACAHGHSFDVNKRGYLTVLDGRSGIHGDTAEILDARDAFLARGHYAPIADAIVGHLRVGALDIADFGCGTGYYLTQSLVARPNSSGLAIDASASAVARAVRATQQPGLVADTWAVSPVLTDSADVILCVFAPRNAAEFSRVLRADGRLIVVTPGERHLEQLRDAGHLIGIQPEKTRRLDETLSTHFALETRATVATELALSPAEVDELTRMGPSGHHAAAALPIAAITPVSVDVTVSVFVPR